jgi:hypothetical protein
MDGRSMTAQETNLALSFLVEVMLFMKMLVMLFRNAPGEP